MLLDRLIAQTPDPKTKAILESCVLVICDNVAEYFYAENPKEDWNLATDFPNVAPPYPRLFLEWPAPHHIVSSKYGEIRISGVARRRCGVMIFSDEVEGHLEQMQEWASQRNQRHLTKIIQEMRANSIPVKWLSYGLVFAEGVGGTDRIDLICHTQWGVDNNGTPIFPNGKISVSHMLIEGFSERELGMMGPGYFYVPFLALSFMHCKNVIMREVTHPAKLQEARIRRGKRPLITYHVLEVHPIRKILESEGKAHKTGLKKALHICRGHFKDFSTGKGLFGKYHGVYWWDAHIRGDKKQGISLKDYDVHAK